MTYSTSPGRPAPPAAAVHDTAVAPFSPPPVASAQEAGNLAPMANRHSPVEGQSTPPAVGREAGNSAPQSESIPATPPPRGTQKGGNSQRAGQCSAGAHNPSSPGATPGPATFARVQTGAPKA
jgi:hypothetical protein